MVILAMTDCIEWKGALNDSVSVSYFPPLTDWPDLDESDT